MEVSVIARALKEFGFGQLGLAGLETRLEGVVQLRFADTNERSVELRGEALPTIVLGKAQVQVVLERFLRGELDRREVSDWAAAIRLLDCFEFESPDEASDAAWDVIDELMSPDSWGELTTEGAIRLIHRLE